MIIKKNYQTKTFDSRFELEIKENTKSRKTVLKTNRKAQRIHLRLHEKTKFI